MQPFASVLADVFADFEAAQAESVPIDDEVLRLSLAAHQTVLAQNGGQLPRPGLHAYAESVAPQPVIIKPMLDVLF